MIELVLTERFRYQRCGAPAETHTPYDVKFGTQIIVNMDTPRFCPDCLTKRVEGWLKRALGNLGMRG